MSVHLAPSVYEKLNCGFDLQNCHACSSHTDPRVRSPAAWTPSAPTRPVVRRQRWSTAPKHRPAVSLGEPPASDLTRELLVVLLAYKAGDFSVRLPTDWTGVP